MVFPVVMHGCESWTVKKAEHQRIDTFELWCWRRLLRVLWTAKRSNQSILKEISPEYSLEGLMLKLKLQYFGHLMRRTDSLEKTWFWEQLKAGGEGDDRGGDGWMASLTQWTWVWASSRSWRWTGKSGRLQSMGSQSQTGLSNWTELNSCLIPRAIQKMFIECLLCVFRNCLATGDMVVNITDTPQLYLRLLVSTMTFQWTCKHDAGQDLHVMAPVFISKYNLVLNFGFKNETMSYNEPHKVKSESFAIWLLRHYWLRK